MACCTHKLFLPEDRSCPARQTLPRMGKSVSLALAIPPHGLALHARSGGELCDDGHRDAQ